MYSVYHRDGCVGRALSCALQTPSWQISSLPGDTMGYIALAHGRMRVWPRIACSITEFPHLQGGRETCEASKPPAALSLTTWKSSASSGPTAPVLLGEVLS